MFPDSDLATSKTYGMPTPVSGIDNFFCGSLLSKLLLCSNCLLLAYSHTNFDRFNNNQCFKIKETL